jgi:hypothetical protein
MQILNFQQYGNVQHVLNNSGSIPTGDGLLESAKEVLLRTLASLPGTVEEAPSTASHGGRFVVQYGDTSGCRTLVCETRSRAWPAEIHGLAHRLGTETKFNGGVPVLIAPQFSESAARVCRDLGLSWLDLAGNCELHLGGNYVRIRVNENPYRVSRSTRSLFAPKSARVVHALLLVPGRAWTTRELAAACDVSVGQVTGVKQLLIEQGWIESRYGTTRLLEPLSLLKEWASQKSPPAEVHRLFSLESPERVASRILDSVPQSLLSSFSAATCYAPYTRIARTFITVPAWDKTWEHRCDLRPGEGGANVIVAVAPEHQRFSETPLAQRCVSPVRCYLDLMSEPVRGIDAAQHLLESVLAERWQ